jgi:hypothetical protein
MIWFFLAGMISGFAGAILLGKYYAKRIEIEKSKEEHE